MALTDFMEGMSLPVRRGKHARGHDITTDVAKRRLKKIKAIKKQQKASRKKNRPYAGSSSGSSLRKGRR